MNLKDTSQTASDLGWSRPWNRDGTVVFRAHRHQLLGDELYFEQVTATVQRLLEGAPSGHVSFAQKLLADPHRLAFTFFHDRREGTRDLEGLTISIGRHPTGHPSDNDRLDLILEDEHFTGCVDRLVDRACLHVCPWFEYSTTSREIFSIDLNPPEGEMLCALQALYAESVARAPVWKHEESPRSIHRAARYPESFGPRTFIPHGSSFD